MNKQIINVNKLSRDDIGSSLEIKINYEFDYQDKEIFDNAKVNGKAEIIKIDNGEFSVEFNLNCMIILPCSRCLNEFALKLKLKFSQEYGYQADDENEVIQIMNNDIDLSNVIEDEIITNIPLKPLCSNDCKGITIK